MAVRRLLSGWIFMRRLSRFLRWVPKEKWGRFFGYPCRLVLLHFAVMTQLISLAEIPDERAELEPIWRRAANLEYGEAYRAFREIEGANS